MTPTDWTRHNGSECPVAVKPLEWRDHVRSGWRVWEAKGLGCTYQCAAKVYNLGWMWGRVEEDSNFDAEDEETAKAAAQADYEQRIRSALIAPSPQPEPAPVRATVTIEPVAIIAQKQEFRHDPANGLHGDCDRTAWAVLLGLPRDAVHNWASGDQDPVAFGDRRNLELRRLGVVPINVAYPGSVSLEDLHATIRGTNPGRPYILGGTSKNGTGHSVVCLDGEIVCDPALDDSGIIGPMEDGMWWVQFAGHVGPAEALATTRAEGKAEGMPPVTAPVAERDEVEKDAWLIVKRDLYFMPGARGYTGIRDHAGRYTLEEAKGWESHAHGTTIIRLADAPEFTSACFDDLARRHITEQRDALREQVTADKAEIARLTDQLNWACKLGDEFAAHARKAQQHSEEFQARAETAESQLAALKAERDGLAKSLADLIGCTHRPNPTDPSRIDVAPGKHKVFQAAIEAARAALEASMERT